MIIKQQILANCSNVVRWMAIRRASNYQIFSAVCLERLPTLAPELNLIEKTMLVNMRKLEAAKSLYSDHEMRHFEDLRRAQRLASGNDVDEKDVEAASKETAQDFDDAVNIEFEKFTFAGRENDVDKSNDQKSLLRSLDKRLILVTKIKQGDAFEWLLPFAKHDGTEPLRQTAERALGQLSGSGSNLNYKIVGNAPCSVYKYRYASPIKSSEGKEGGKIFFYKAILQSGDLDSKSVNSKLVQDYLWLRRDEFTKLMLENKRRKYLNAIDHSFLPELKDDKFVSRVLSKVRQTLTKNADLKEVVAVA